jgi:hypothetical protein
MPLPKAGIPFTYSLMLVNSRVPLNGLFELDENAAPDYLEVVT